MSYQEYTNNLRRLKYLLERQHAGTPGELAKKLSISERTLLRMVHQLRTEGCSIVFNRSSHTYEVRSS